MSAAASPAPPAHPMIDAIEGYVAPSSWVSSTPRGSGSDVAAVVVLAALVAGTVDGGTVADAGVVIGAASMTDEAVIGTSVAGAGSSGPGATVVGTASTGGFGGATGG